MVYISLLHTHCDHTGHLAQPQDAHWFTIHMASILRLPTDCPPGTCPPTGCPQAAPNWGKSSPKSAPTHSHSGAWRPLAMSTPRVTGSRPLWVCSFCRACDHTHSVTNMHINLYSMNFNTIQSTLWRPLLSMDLEECNSASCCSIKEPLELLCNHELEF